MSTSQTNSFLLEIAERKPIPTDKLAYFQARLRHNLYDFILGKFAEMEEVEGLTKAELARRIGCEPSLVTRRLGAPGNWTIDTISDLLIGIAGEELDPQSKSVFGRAKRNYDGRKWREPKVDEPKKAKEKVYRRSATAREATNQRSTLSAASATTTGVNITRGRRSSVTSDSSRSLTGIETHS